MITTISEKNPNTFSCLGMIVKGLVVNKEMNTSFEKWMALTVTKQTDIQTVDNCMDFSWVFLGGVVCF